MKVGDIQIVLHWIYNHHKALKQWVRTRVIKIGRFTERSQWYYIESKRLIADLGTRKGAKLSDVDANSAWINGYEWMRKDESTFPLLSISDLKLSASENESFKKETFSPYQSLNDLTSFKWPQSNQCFSNSVACQYQNLDLTEISAHYEFSQYLIDPNTRKFASVVRVVAIIKKFIHMCRHKIAIRKGISDIPNTGRMSDVLTLTDKELTEGRNYFFKKATSEVKRFVKKQEYNKISTERDGILYYTGRIMPKQNVNAVAKLTDVMKDLSDMSFLPLSLPIIHLLRIVLLTKSTGITK